MSPLAKLVWLRHEKPDLFGRATRFIGIKEYVLFRLFGLLRGGLFDRVGDWPVQH